MRERPACSTARGSRSRIHASTRTARSTKPTPGSASARAVRASTPSWPDARNDPARSLRRRRAPRRSGSQRIAERVTKAAVRPEAIAQLEAGSIAGSASCRRCAASSSRAARPLAPRCTSRARSAAAPSGVSSRSARMRWSRRCRRTSIACPTSCSSWRERPTSARAPPRRVVESEPLGRGEV